MAYSETFSSWKPNGFQSVLRTAWNQWGWWHPPLGTTSCKLLPPGTQYLFNKWRHCWKCRQKSLIFLDCRFDGPVGSEGFWKKRKNSLRLKELCFLCLHIPHSPWHNENSSRVMFLVRAPQLWFLLHDMAQTSQAKNSLFERLATQATFAQLKYRQTCSMEHLNTRKQKIWEYAVCSRVNWIWDLRFSNSNTTKWKLAFQPTSSITSLQSAEDGHRTFQLGGPCQSAENTVDQPMKIPYSCNIDSSIQQGIIFFTFCCRVCCCRNFDDRFVRGIAGALSTDMLAQYSKNACREFMHFKNIEDT